MLEDDTVRLRHMLDAARQALEFARGKSHADLDRDAMLALALVKLVEIVGEAASQVSDVGRTKAPNLPWAASSACGIASFTRTLTSTAVSFGKRYSTTCLLWS